MAAHPFGKNIFALAECQTGSRTDAPELDAKGVSDLVEALARESGVEGGGAPGWACGQDDPAFTIGHHDRVERIWQRSEGGPTDRWIPGGRRGLDSS